MLHFLIMLCHTSLLHPLCYFTLPHCICLIVTLPPSHCLYVDHLCCLSIELCSTIPCYARHRASLSTININNIFDNVPCHASSCLQGYSLLHFLLPCHTFTSSTIDICCALLYQPLIFVALYFIDHWHSSHSTSSTINHRHQWQHVQHYFQFLGSINLITYPILITSNGVHIEKL